VLAFLAIVRRDLALSLRQGLDSMMAVAFFVLGVVLFPFGVGPDPDILARVAAGVIWVAALLAAMLSLERLFLADFEDGTLELLALSPAPLMAVVAAKVAGHWLTSGLPLILASPLLALLLNLDGAAIGVMLVALALGTPTLSLVGAVGAALVLGSRRGGVLLGLLILPLNIPVLIFGVAAVEAAAGGYPVAPPLTVLAGLMTMAAVLGPWAAAAAVRQALE
jgi:heme exporter protein B